LKSLVIDRRSDRNNSECDDDDAGKAGMLLRTDNTRDRGVIDPLGH
jgi:hypothetical protein